MSGIGYPQKPNRRLVGDCLRLPIKAVPRWGTVTLTWPENQAHALHAEVTRTAADRITISTGGVETEITLLEWAMPVVRGRQRGIRWRFACVHCGASRDALHFVDGEWRCRGASCGNLAFASRHRQRYCPAIRRRARLLRKLTRVPPQSLKARMLQEMIAQQEAAMLASVKQTNNDLKRRRQRYANRVDISQ